jgi:AhpD family alkylhydroperoxidase
MDKLDEFYKTIQTLEKDFPKETSAFMGFLAAVEKKGALDTKVKELIALAAGMVKHCEWCIAYHTKGASDAGANREEILEAAWVGALMDGGPGIAHMFPVLRSLDELKIK